MPDVNEAFSLPNGQKFRNRIAKAAMTEGLHIHGGRIYIAGRGAGVISADRSNLADHTSWKSVPFEWNQPEPQPHPVSHNRAIRPFGCRV
jgi:hypothetical protein